MRKGFSLVELMIVVAVLGILAAMVLPDFQSHTQDSKGAAARSNLHILRTGIELYAAQHNDLAPGYPANNPDNPALELEFKLDMLRENYLKKIPKNSFNKLDTFNMIQNDAPLPSEATGQYGWVYQAQSKTIRLDWPGNDRAGVRYYDY